MRSERVKELVRKHYSDRSVREWERLTSDPYHLLEFDTTMHFLKKYLPKKGLVLDAGGGPGRYTIALARLGYDVILLDITPKLLEIAREEMRKAKVESNVKQIIEGSIDNLHMFKNNTFDAVICFGGTLNHLMPKKQRLKAVDELIRVAKDNAPIFVSVVGRMAILMNTIVSFLPILEEYPDGWRKCVVTGDDEINVPRHYYLPEELEAEFKAKTRIVEMVGLEGIFSTHAKEYNEAHEAGKYSEILGEMHLKTCTDPSMVSISEHFMLICKKCKTLIGRSSMLSSQTYQLKNGSSVVSAREIRE